MDATENDLPPSVPFRVSGFPTLKFKPAGSRDFVDYEGDRSLESLVEFVEATAKNAIPASKPAAASPKVEEAEAQAPLVDVHDEL
jgi:protein disulfide-isomerase A1